MKWISVKDKLPEPSNEPLLVRTSDSDLSALAIFVDGHWEVQPLYTTWYTTKGLVTHWMPLPELPQDKNEPEFDEYEIYYFDELIAEVKDYRKGFDSIIYGLSTDTQAVKKYGSQSTRKEKKNVCFP